MNSPDLTLVTPTTPLSTVARRWAAALAREGGENVNMNLAYDWHGVPVKVYAKSRWLDWHWVIEVTVTTYAEVEPGKYQRILVTESVEVPSA
jgi:hypothetical protein